MSRFNKIFSGEAPQPPKEIVEISEQTLQQLADSFQRLASVDPTINAIFQRIHQRYPVDNLGQPSINLLRVALIAAILLHEDKLHLQQHLLTALEQMPLPVLKPIRKEEDD